MSATTSSQRASIDDGGRLSSGYPGMGRGGLARNQNVGASKTATMAKKA
jgi:hypothetical protein